MAMIVYLLSIKVLIVFTPSSKIISSELTPECSGLRERVAPHSTNGT